MAILDALGAARFDIDASCAFLDSRDATLLTTEQAFKGAQDESRGKFGTVVERYYLLGKPYAVLTFGDSIILVWRDSPEKIRFQLGFIGLWLAFIHNHLFHQGILLRGALSVGNFVLDLASHSVLGPAVASAVGYYDKHQMLGVVATPECGSRIDAIEKAGELDKLNEPYDGLFNKYEVPFKKCTESLWTIGWPCVMRYSLSAALLQVKGFANVRQAIAAALDAHVWTDESQPKKQNTLDYVDHCLTAYLPRVSKAPRLRDYL